MHDGSINIRLRADLTEIERLHHLVRLFGELHEIPGRTLYKINLALDELVTNAILYGYEDATGHEILVGIVLEGGEMRITVRDKGKAFDPLSIATPDLQAPLQERQVGGVGIYLVRSLMENLEYRREGEMNVLSLSKRIR